MMQYFISIIIYTLQAGILILIAGVLPYLIYRWTKRRLVFLVALCLALIIEGSGIFILAKKPIWICPQEYQTYISEECKEQIIGFNSGLYSSYIPVFPICISVQHANSDSITVRTNYFFFGQTEMIITDDGPSLVHGLLAQ